MPCTNPQGSIPPESRPTLNARFGTPGSRFCELVPKSSCGKFHQIGNEKRPRVYECYWAHFAAEIQLSE